MGLQKGKNVLTKAKPMDVKTWKEIQQLNRKLD